MGGGRHNCIEKISFFFSFVQKKSLFFKRDEVVKGFHFFFFCKDIFIFVKREKKPLLVSNLKRKF